MAVYIKSFLYLGVFGTLGYALMVITEPTKERKQIIAQTGYSDPSSDEVKAKKALFLQRLKEATTDTPIYLKKSPTSKATTQEIENPPKQPTNREINWIKNHLP